MHVPNNGFTYLVKAKAQPIHHVHVTDLGSFEDGQRMVELLAVVRGAHVVVTALAASASARGEGVREWRDA